MAVSTINYNANSYLLMVRPNGLPISRAALIDWENSRADTSFPKRPDFTQREAAAAAWAC
jgi:hypothetical protein